MSSVAPADIINAAQKNINWDSQIRYSELKTNPNTGAKSINISRFNAGKTSKLVLTSPPIMTWGVNSYEGKKYDMNMQFPDSESLATNPDLAALLQNLQALEDKIREDAVTNCRSWFGKPKMTKEQIDVLWNPMLRYKIDPSTGEPDKTKSPTWRIKFPYWEDKDDEGKYTFHCEIYDMEGNALYLPPTAKSPNTKYQDVDMENLIQKKSDVTFMVVNGGIWFANGKFGTTWRLMQAAVEQKESIEGKCMLFGTQKPKASTTTTHVVDTDDEDEAPPANIPESNDADVDVAPPPTPVQPSTDDIMPNEPEDDAPNTKTTGVSQPKKKKVVKK